MGHNNDVIFTRQKITKIQLPCLKKKSTFTSYNKKVVNGVRIYELKVAIGQLEIIKVVIYAI